MRYHIAAPLMRSLPKFTQSWALASHSGVASSLLQAVKFTAKSIKTNNLDFICLFSKTKAAMEVLLYPHQGKCSTA
jgi:hypothetical protein